jgi:DNA-binding HxlR family transcriptional regulator
LIDPASDAFQRAIDLLSAPPAVRIVVLLAEDGPLPVAEIRARLGDGAADRLAGLEARGIVVVAGAGCRLTEKGAALARIALAIGEWADRWTGVAAPPTPIEDDLDEDEEALHQLLACAPSPESRGAWH